MNNTWTVIIIGIYTLVYVVVFFIQKSQISKQEAIINSMTSFMQIFDTDKVRSFIKMKEETQLFYFKQLMNDNENFKKIATEIADSKISEIEEEYGNKVGYKFAELTNFVFDVLSQQDEEKREILLDKYFPLNKDFMNFLLEKHCKSNS